MEKLRRVRLCNVSPSGWDYCHSGAHVPAHRSVPIQYRGARWQSWSGGRSERSNVNNTSSCALHLAVSMLASYSRCNRRNILMSTCRFTGGCRAGRNAVEQPVPPTAAGGPDGGAAAPPARHAAPAPVHHVPLRATGRVRLRQSRQ